MAYGISVPKSATVRKVCAACRSAISFGFSGWCFGGVECRTFCRSKFVLKLHSRDRCQVQLRCWTDVRSVELTFHTFVHVGGAWIARCEALAVLFDMWAAFQMDATLAERVSHKSRLQEHSSRVAGKSDLQECRRKCVPQASPTKVSHKSLLRSVLQACLSRVSEQCCAKSSWTYISKRVLQESTRVLTRVSPEVVVEECPARVLYKRFQQECRLRVSGKTSVQQESCKSMKQEPCTSVAHDFLPSRTSRTYGSKTKSLFILDILKGVLHSVHGVYISRLSMDLP